MAVNSSANSVILVLFAFSDNLSAENSKLSAESWNRGNHLLGCMDQSLITSDDQFISDNYFLFLDSCLLFICIPLLPLSVSLGN